jgi:hypothetical protein
MMGARQDRTTLLLGAKGYGWPCKNTQTIERSILSCCPCPTRGNQSILFFRFVMCIRVLCYLLLLLFVYTPPVGSGFLCPPTPWTAKPDGSPLISPKRENLGEVPKSHYAQGPCVLLSVISLYYIHIILDVGYAIF